MTIAAQKLNTSTRFTYVISLKIPVAAPTHDRPEGDALLPQLGQPFVVDLDTGGSGDWCIVPKDIAHVVEQPGG